MNEPGLCERHVPTERKEKPPAPIAEQGVMDGFGTWTLYEDGLLVIDGKGGMPDWDWECKTCNTTAPWWRKQDAIKRIKIAMGVTSIGDRAFYSCTRLTGITIPKSVTSIGVEAFSCCDSLTSIRLPGSVTSIGESAFWCCDRLASIRIPKSVTIIGEEAFLGCKSLTEITIPDSVMRIDENAFLQCESLKKVTMPSRLDRYFFKDYYGIPRRIVTLT